MIRCVMTSDGGCRAPVLLMLVVTNVILIELTACLNVRHRHSPTVQQASPQTAELTHDGEQSATLDASVLRTVGLERVVSSSNRPRRRRVSAAQRVVVPEYMWQLYRRQRRANRERQHRRSSSTTSSSDFTHQPPPYYSANTIRSFVATSYSDSQTGKCYT